MKASASPYSPSRQSETTSHPPSHDQSEISQQKPLHNQPGDAPDPFALEDEDIDSYEEMVLNGQRFLCGIPKVSVSGPEQEAATTSPSDEEKELARATSRGLELLKDMEGRCMYYSAGWWSYSFCYMNQVRQFHALLPGNGVPVYPPAEDPSTQTYVLGRFRPSEKDDNEQTPKKSTTTEVSTLQTQGDSWYLKQYLEDGTMCDLTGKNRKIEVQFHCHPHSTDHIAWIKEVTTCTYLMVVYTPKLCNDVAFQPPREDKAQGITCREIISPEEIAEWEASKAARAKQGLVDGPAEEFPVIGGVEVGAMKLVGQEGNRIEKGRVAFAGQEKVEIVAKSEGGEIQRLSKEQMKRFNLDPEKIESLRKRLEDLADGKDWKLEMVDANGERGLRGIIDNQDEDDGDLPEGQANHGHREGEAAEAEAEAEQERERERREKKGAGQQKAPEDEYQTGSDETYKDEL